MLQKVFGFGLLLMLMTLQLGGCFVDSRCYTDRDCAPPLVCINKTCQPQPPPLTVDGQELAPQFTLTDVNPFSTSYGQAVTLADYAGKVVVLYFAQAG